MATAVLKREPSYTSRQQEQEHYELHKQLTSNGTDSCPDLNLELTVSYDSSFYKSMEYGPNYFFKSKWSKDIKHFC